jgi:hypothetical protein
MNREINAINRGEVAELLLETSGYDQGFLRIRHEITLYRSTSFRLGSGMRQLM